MPEARTMLLGRILLAVLALPATRGGIAAQAPVKLTLTETLRLDANAEDFPGIGAAFTGPRGIITIPLFTDNQIRFYDSTGKRIATFGRKGAGPGEFERMLRHGWVADTLWVYDSNHRRFTLISSAGRLIRTVQQPASLNAGETGGIQDYSNGVFSYVPNAYFADGSSMGSAMLMKGKTAEGTVDTDQFVIRAAASGTVTRLVRKPSIEESFVEAKRLQSSWSWALPFVFQSQTVFSHDGSRVGFLTVQTGPQGNGTYTVAVYTSRGDTVFVRSYPYTGVPIPSRSMDSAITAAVARGKSAPPDVAAELEKGIRERAPKTYAPVGAMYFGSDGTVWITQRRTTEGVLALVLNSRGDQIASLQLPPRSSIREASLTSLLVSETDEDDLSSLVRYRVSGRTCSPPECR
jgi:hypothetical protein